MRRMRRRRCYGDDKSRHPQAVINNSQNSRRTPVGRPDAAYGRRVGSKTGRTNSMNPIMEREIYSCGFLVCS